MLFVGVGAILNNIPWLKDLVLEGCNKVDDKVFKSVAMVLQDNLVSYCSHLYV